jgi:N-acetylglucosamine-6-phosphate deacetylase
MRKLLRNCQLLDPESPAPSPGALLIEDGRIAARLEADCAVPGDAETVDLEGRALAPGFIDLHFHGSTIFHDADSVAGALAHDADRCARHGTTAFLATTVAEPAAGLLTRTERLASAIDEAAPGSAVPLGIHLEGPWIHPGAAGAQPGPGIRPYRPEELAELLSAAAGAVRMVTLAPELEGGPQLIEALARSGIIPALGHSLATAEQVDDAVSRGARHVTHLFNAMGPLHHRQPGLAGATLSDDRLSCDLICDGCHVDPRMTRLVARVKGDRALLISDRIDPPDPGAGFGSGALQDDGEAWRLPDGRLAASRLHLDQAIANVVAWGTMTQLEAVAACTLRPARLLGVEAERGTLRPGARADLTLLDPAGHSVRTWVGGREAAAQAG